MDDAKRRGAVLHWIRTVGDPWIRSEHPPAPGSSLAGDDKIRPAVSELARFGIATAVDHLGLVVDAMAVDAPFRHYAPLTALRTALLASARTIWLLEPSGRSTRQFRAARLELDNLTQQRRAINELLEGSMSGELRDSGNRAVAQLDRQIDELRKDTQPLCPGENLSVPDTVSLIKALVEPNTDLGSGVRHLWRTGSAAAHGLHWANLEAGEFDEQSFNMSLYASMMMVRSALELFEKRAANHFYPT